jgi:Flp pilus assembly protein TadG
MLYRQLSNPQWAARRGIVVPMAALLLVGLLGVTAIAVDGGLLLADKRRVQAAADAAALAAAIELFTNSPTGTDLSGNAAGSAQKTASDNGFTNKVNGTTVTVNIPPKSGPYTGINGYAEVIITMEQKRYFSTMT